MAIGPPGRFTVLKMAASSSERSTMSWIHAGITPSAATAPAVIATRTTEVLIRTLRDNFNLHLLRADVVRNVLGGDREPVAAWRKFFRHHDSTGTRSRVRIPTQTHRRRAFKLRDQRSRAGGSLYLQLDLVAVAVFLSVKHALKCRRLAGHYQALGLA